MSSLKTDRQDYTASLFNKLFSCWFKMYKYNWILTTLFLFIRWFKGILLQSSSLWLQPTEWWLCIALFVWLVTQLNKFLIVISLDHIRKVSSVLVNWPFSSKHPTTALCLIFSYYFYLFQTCNKSALSCWCWFDRRMKNNLIGDQWLDEASFINFPTRDYEIESMTHLKLKIRSKFLTIRLKSFAKVKLKASKHCYLNSKRW